MTLELQRKLKLKRAVACLLAVLITALTACRAHRNSNMENPTDAYADEICQKLTEQGVRTPGSEAAKAAAEYIKSEFQKLGYVPEEQPVAGMDGANIVVRIPGFNMRYNQRDLQNKARYITLGDSYARSSGIAVVMARYTTVTAKEITEADGLCDNAAGVAALLKLAKQLKQNKVGYDVVLAAICSNNSEGGSALLQSLKPNENKIAVAYELRNIFGGSRLYAHAGWNSLNNEMKYAHRLPVYQIVDLALEEGLGGSQSPYESIYTNQSGFSVASPLNSAENVVYREFTSHESDYRAFDAAGIDTVYIESWNYAAKDLAGIKQTDSRLFANSKGQLSGTNNDNYKTLMQTFSREQLIKRVNSAAFIVLRALIKGALDSKVNSINY